ncbi:Citrinin biosynthesis transcriptional activator ctnR [Exophiala dermatitidis]
MASPADFARSQEVGDMEEAHNGGGSNEAVPRPKRIACILCRKRKLKCDGNKPSCGTCSRLNHRCEYSEERKKSGPKRGYVKLLEARLKQVENLLESRESTAATSSAASQMSKGSETYAPGPSMPSMDIPSFGDASMSDLMQDGPFPDPAMGGLDDFTMDAGNDFSWEMIGLGLEEALPPREVIDELNEIYFEKVHPSLPMIQKARFLASMDLAPHLRPPACLRYAIWANACAITPKYSASTPHFYERARKYAELDEMRGLGESMISVSHCQAWTLLACFEFKHMYFPRAWMSVGRAARLAQMMGLHRQDGAGLDVKQTLPPPRDWTDQEERRRTFWMAFCQDRYASVGTGWPMVIDENDILTNLPASEEAFNKGQPEPTLSLGDLLNGDGASSISSFGGIILMSTLYGRNLTHLHRPEKQDNDHDLNGPFWKRHRSLDNILLNTSLSLPPHLRLPAGINDPNTIFLNMNIHTATICLHQAAIFKADKNRLPAQISAESKRRCIVAADQITSIMKMISHLDMSVMNPFLAFCLYVAARVFVQYLKARKDDAAVKSSLQFLLSAMHALTAKNPLTESFLVQLDVDLEGSGLNISSNVLRWKFGHRPPAEVPANTDALKCSPLFEIRESQQRLNPKGVNPPWPQEMNSIANALNNPFPRLYASGGSSSSGRTGPASSIAEGFDGSSFDLPLHSLSSGTSPDTSHQEGGSSSRQHSNQPTPPSLSHQTSSGTSYTSPSSQIFGGQAHSANDSQLPKPQQPQQQQHTFGLAGGGGDSWHNNMNPAVFQRASPPTNSGQQQQQQPSVDFGSAGTGLTPGPTGLTPMSDSMWPPTGLVGDANDWMFGWTGSTPQPEQ